MVYTLDSHFLDQRHNIKRVERKQHAISSFHVSVEPKHPISNSA
jgi:hypothetical protein